MDGIFNIDKPAGNTSFSIVSIVRRLTGERRVGHAGTLDPIASGVLPVCCGRGTKVVEFLLETSKIYRAQIELGIATDSYDASGEITARGDYSGLETAHIKQVLNSFRGSIQQVPPMFSALKYNGRRLYHLAREGISVDRESRPATIHNLELLNFKPPLLTLEVECSRGTYIRSLAHDLGELLGCGAHLRGLVRLSYGPFDIKASISPSLLEEAFNDNTWQQFIYPIDSVLGNWPAAVVGDEQEQVIKNGGCISIDGDLIKDGQQGRCRAYNKDGRFLALLYFDDDRGQWQPDKVFV